MNRAEKEAALLNLKGEIIANKVCDSLAKQATQLVTYKGNPDAGLVFVGEAPGKDEDKAGIPFVGQAGEYLDERMIEAGLLDRVGDSWEKAAVMNALGYRPKHPNKPNAIRPPRKSELREYHPYFLEMLRIMDPTHVVAVGSKALQNFMPDASIDDIHGESQDIVLHGKDVLLMPMYHPSATIYNKDRRQALLDDFKKIPDWRKISK